MSNVKNPPVKADAADPVAALTKLLEDFGPAALAKADQITRAFKIAEGVRLVRTAIRGAIDRIMPLQGSALGFRTDKDKDGGYGPDVVADCATEALLRGLRLTGNEWNIIGGRCYVAQAGCARLVAELPGLTDLEHAPGIPVLREGGAIVEYTATWKQDGRPMALTRKIPIRVNNGMGADAILGKAKRKMLAAVYERVTGSVLSDGDTDESPMLPAAPSKPAALAERIAQNRPAPLPPKDVERDEFGQPIFGQEAGASLFDKEPAKLPD